MSEAIAQPGEPAFDLELIRRTVAQGATNDELALYLHDCQRRGVHPLDKLLHFTKRGGKYTPITSIDLFRARAGATGQHAGTDDAIYAEDASGKIVSAKVTVYRLIGGVRCPFGATAYWSEYNAGGPMWTKMPRTMIAKCAEALALRKAFPQELGGLYTADEMEQAGGQMSVEANSLSPAEQQAARQAHPQPPPTEHVSKERLEAIGRAGKAAGYKDGDWADVLRRYEVKRLSNLTAEKGQRLILEILQRRVAQVMAANGHNLDDARNMVPGLAADEVEELTWVECDAVLDAYETAGEGVAA